MLCANNSGCLHVTLSVSWSGALGIQSTIPSVSEIELHEYLRRRLLCFLHHFLLFLFFFRLPLTSASSSLQLTLAPLAIMHSFSFKNSLIIHEENSKEIHF